MTVDSDNYCENVCFIVSFAVPQLSSQFVAVGGRFNQRIAIARLAR